MNRRTPRSPFMGGAKPHRGPGTRPEYMEPIIAGRDLRKSWGATLVLEHADFLLHAGDKVALVGPGSARSESVIVNDPILNDLGVGEELLDQRFGSLSGGEKSKVLTARALANAKEKDVLLLDEPTNHMDVDTIETIEEFLLDIDAAVLLASHDKFLLDAIAEKVIELDRFRTLEYVGNYTDYRVQRDAIARRRQDDPPRSPDRTPGGGHRVRVPGQEPGHRLLRPRGGGTRLLPHPLGGDQ